jgi:hydroxymethylpyrimidine pyrophosphatase-like HAD family hydrolase
MEDGVPNQFPEFPEVTYFNQVSTSIEPVEATRVVVERIREVYGEWLNPLQNGCCIDIVPNGVNKAKGLYRLMEHYGCSYEDVIAVGDNINDADMIREFRSYAMANGVDLIKEMADYVVEDVMDLIDREI